MMFKYALSSHKELTEEDLACLEILNPELSSAHQKRQASFLCARKALQKLVPPTQLQSLQLNGFHFLQQFPQSIFSLAHTQDIAIALMAQKKDFKSIGIDLEYLEREVKEGSERHFINQNDDRGLSDLELWCAKEASFKAVSSLYPQLVLKDLWIQELGFGHLENPQNILGKIQFIKEEKLLIAVALVHESSNIFQITKN